jgi:hypothetical protein
MLNACFDGNCSFINLFIASRPKHRRPAFEKNSEQEKLSLIPNLNHYHQQKCGGFQRSINSVKYDASSSIESDNLSDISRQAPRSSHQRKLSSAHVVTPKLASDQHTSPMQRLP